MGGQNTQSKQVKFYNLKAKASANEDPHFAVSEKINGKWQTTHTFNSMVGMLESADIVQKETEKAGKFNAFILVLNDGTETSQVEFPHSDVAHNLINCLASDCNTLQEYSFTLTKKQWEGGWNGNCFVNIKDQKESLRWSIDPKLAPKKEPVMILDDNNQPVQMEQAGKKVWKRNKMNAFWEDVFKTKIISVLGSGSAASPTSKPVSDPMQNSSQADKVERMNEQMDDDLSDLPF